MPQPLRECLASLLVQQLLCLNVLRALPSASFSLATLQQCFSVLDSTVGFAVEAINLAADGAKVDIQGFQRGIGWWCLPDQASEFEVRQPRGSLIKPLLDFLIATFLGLNLGACLMGKPLDSRLPYSLFGEANSSCRSCLSGG
ncbi:hypothetical protein CO610_02160 [Lysobacteraceae bacterium NML95-0200]|nr:hypothetical protein CO610_02160 [Xanthomonadaceae bacterium NML95-0200]